MTIRDWASRVLTLLMLGGMLALMGYPLWGAILAGLFFNFIAWNLPGMRDERDDG